jgi:tRNA(Ile)-lysidine synthase
MTEEQLPAMVIFRSDRELVLSVPRASPVPTSLRRRILRRSAHLLRGDRPGFSFRQTLALERLLLSDKAQGALHLSGGIHATKAGDRLILSLREHGARDSGRPIPLAVPGQTELPTCSLRFRTDTLEGATGGLLAHDQWTALLDADRAGGELVVRFWERGDRFVPLGMRGRKKLQDFFVDARVPRDQRWTVPLVVSGGEIAWVVGFRVDERFKVTDSTQRILRLRVAHAGRRKQSSATSHRSGRFLRRVGSWGGGQGPMGCKAFTPARRIVPDTPALAETTIRHGFCVEKQRGIW